MDRVDLVRVAGYGAGGDEEGRDVRHERVEAEHCGVFVVSSCLLRARCEVWVVDAVSRRGSAGLGEVTLDRCQWRGSRLARQGM